MSSLASRLKAYLNAHPDVSEYPNPADVDAWEAAQAVGDDRFKGERFTVRPAVRDVVSTDAWIVFDRDADMYHMTHTAVTLRMRLRAATQIAVVLNEEWAAFLRNPN